MRIDNQLLLHVVSEGRVTTQQFETFLNAIRGGLKAEQVAIFTDLAEANDYALRRDLLERGAAALREIDNGPLETIVKSLEEGIQEGIQDPHLSLSSCVPGRRSLF